MISKDRRTFTIGHFFAILVIAAIFFLEYIGFMVVFMGRLLELVKGAAIFFLVETNILVILLVWSYVKVVASGPGYLVKDESLPNLEQIKNTQMILQRYRLGAPPPADPDQPIEIVIAQQNGTSQVIRISHEENERIKQIAKNPFAELTEMSYCHKCNAAKLPRAHHCSQCKKCVARMDHHCPWVANCVGLHNHKFFILFLLYAIVLLFQIVLLEAGYFYANAYGFQDEMSKESILVVNMTAILGVSTLFGTGFMAFFHVYITMKNLTTIEMHLKDITHNNPFDKGRRKNWESIFGERPIEWFLPLSPKFTPGRENLLREIP